MKNSHFKIKDEKFTFQELNIKNSRFKNRRRKIQVSKIEDKKFTFQEFKTKNSHFKN